jgi:two-component system, chemotaxis family, response regulator Rcp1
VFGERHEQMRWEITVAKDGEDAIEALFGQTNLWPDLILLDWNLPKLGGGEVLRRVKRHRLMSKIPVLIFSSSASESDIQAAYKDHANGWIVKPNGVDALEAIVERIERFWIQLSLKPSHA